MDIEATVFLEESARRTVGTWTEPVEAIARFALAVIDGIVLRWLVVSRQAPRSSPNSTTWFASSAARPSRRVRTWTIVQGVID